jgi:hypothetical protein
MNIRFQMVFAVADRPYQCPAWIVPPGAVVTLRTVNGNILNTGSVFVAEYPEGLRNGNVMALPPGADVEVSWPVDNTCQIWASGQGPGDGLLVTVIQAAIG